MSFEHDDGTESERRRRRTGKRAGRPGEGFAEVVKYDDEPGEAEGGYQELLNTIRGLMKGHRKMLEQLNCADNPSQHLLQCPSCKLQNDFNVEGMQIFYFSKDVRKGKPPSVSTTVKRLVVLEENEDEQTVRCQCENCEKEVNIDLKGMA